MFWWGVEISAGQETIPFLERKTSRIRSETVEHIFNDYKLYPHFEPQFERKKSHKIFTGFVSAHTLYDTYN